MLYLQNVRDLEVVKVKITGLYHNYKRDIEIKMSKCQTEAHWKDVPYYEDEDNGVFKKPNFGTWFFGSMVCLNVFCFFGLIYGSITGEFTGHEDNLSGLSIMVMLGLLIFIPLTKFFWPESKKHWEARMADIIQKRKEYNAQQEALAEQGREQVKKLQSQLDSYHAQCNEEFR